ncbi:alpha-amylase family protein [Modestobacter sp. VKM Ac-2984]|uniref:alpha-amylase family protein n=1 Tax=Modestobacter sp. VKM Ac-2984 TaxID=3004138 RepID=UPI0022AA20FD|nr:alpha-amylase family protein [Modestobacter sp. VKM Ac-2984]MCZ2816345.1 beta-galactosidase [Modestobacter sp. VKM Ac-2984]
MPDNSGPTQRDLPAGSRWREPFTVLQTNLQQVDADVDVEVALDAVEDHGADTWLLNAGGISSFYPTDLPFQTRNPLLAGRASGDLFGDAVAAAKRRAVRVIARLDMSKVSSEIAEEHPDWLYRSPDGEPQLYNTLYSTCPSAEYYQERTLDVVDEVLDRYDVDGLFFNWFNFNERDYDEVNHPPCHCAACRAGFAEFSGGKQLPTTLGGENFGLWRQYTSATLARLTATIVDHVAARDRDIGVLLRRGAPIVYLEGNNAYRAMPGKEFWPHATAEAVSAHVSSQPGSAVMVNCVAFIDHAYRMGAEQPEHFAQYLVQTVARGGNPSAFFFGAPGRLPMQRALSLGREVMRFRRDHVDLYRQLEPAAPVALVRPDYGSVTTGTYWEVIDEFRGVYEALLEQHVPFDVVPVGDLAAVAAAGALDRYSLVVLPDVGTLGRGAAGVDDYVSRGGKLLITGAAGVSRDGAVELECSPALRPVTPALAGADLWSTYVTDREQPRMAEHHYDAPILPVMGRYQRFEWRPDVRTVGFVLPRAPHGPPELAYGHTASDDPDRVQRRFGSGEVVLVPWTVGRTYREYGKTDVRDHLGSVVRSLVDPAVTAELHDRVEVVVGESGGSTVVHLLNHSGARRRSYGAHVPVAGGSLRLRGRGAEDLRVDALVAGVPLQTRADGADRVVDLPTVGLFEVVRITAAS